MRCSFCSLFLNSGTSQTEAAPSDSLIRAAQLLTLSPESSHKAKPHSTCISGAPTLSSAPTLTINGGPVSAISPTGVPVAWQMKAGEAKVVSNSTPNSFLCHSGCTFQNSGC